jgi:hypothetical protein
MSRRQPFIEAWIFFSRVAAVVRVGPAFFEPRQNSGQFPLARIFQTRKLCGGVSVCGHALLT